MNPVASLCASIVMLALGGLGDSLQPARLVLLMGLPWAIGALVVRKQWDHLDGIAACCYAVLLGFGLASLTWTPDIQAGMAKFAVVSIGASSLLYVLATPGGVSSARRLRDAWSVALALTLPLAGYELATGNHFAYALDERDLGAGLGEAPFASAFFGNFNDYCTFIALTLPMLLGTIESAVRPLRRWAWTALALFAIVVIAVNTNRLSMIFVAWLLIFQVASRRIWRRIALLVLATIVLVVASGALSEQLDSIVYLASLRFEILGTDDDSVDQRSGLIIAGARSLMDTYGMGMGIGAYEGYLRQKYPDLIPNPHNLVVELAANFGLIPLVAMGALFVLVFLRIARSHLPSDIARPLMLTLPFVPAIGAISSQAIGYTYWWLWFATAIYVAKAAGIPQREYAHPDPATTNSSREFSA